MGTLEEILAQLKAQDSRLQELELENGRLRDQVADLKSQLEKVEREGKQQAAPFRKPRDQRKPPEDNCTYQAKLEMGTLPANALPGPYLGGIIRNKNRQLEITLKSERNIENRRKFDDLSLRHLAREAGLLEKESDPALLWSQKLSRALHAPRALDYYFWSGLCAEHLARLDHPERLALYGRSTRYIAANFKADGNRQESLIGRLARACFQ